MILKIKGEQLTHSGHCKTLRPLNIYMYYKINGFFPIYVDCNTLTALKSLHNTAGLEQEKYVRRRKKSSTSRSRHSSHNSNLSDDCERINGEIIGIHQLENEAFLEGHEISDSFSIEFASSSNKGLELPKNGFHNNVIKENSASNSIVFRYSDSGQNKVGVGYIMYIMIS